MINNRPPKDWNKGYELVVSFQYGLNEDAIAKVAGLRNYDTGCTLKTMVRDLFFPCGTDNMLAHTAANRLIGLDQFGALRIKIRYPLEFEGKDAYVPWYTADGKLIERLKHCKYSFVDVRKGKSIKRIRKEVA